MVGQIPIGQPPTNQVVPSSVNVQDSVSNLGYSNNFKNASQKISAVHNETAAFQQTEESVVPLISEENSQVELVTNAQAPIKEVVEPEGG